MKIVSSDKEVHQILDTGYYKIPRFQRPYLWDRDNVEEFWSDTISGGELDYFIGSMVVYKIGKSMYGLVDGQQRLTTIIMILCALRNQFDILELSDLAKGIHTRIERLDINNRNQYILQTETSYPYLQEYVLKHGFPSIQIQEPGREEERLKKAFDFIADQIYQNINVFYLDPTLNDEERLQAATQRLIAIRDKVLSLKLILIELEEEDDAYIIFETLNTRGKDLGVSDLVKNHLTRLIKQDNVGVDITKDKWNQIVEIIESSEADLDTNVYIHHFWLSRYQYTSAQKLFALLKRQVKRPEIAEMFLDDLLTDSETYRIINEPDFRKSWERGEDRVRGALDALKLFRVEQPLPMILSIMREYFVGHLSKTHARDILGAIENFHFVFTAITSQRSSGGISSMYALHARDLLSAQTQDQKVRVLRELKGKLRAKRPSFDEFKANFRELLYSDNHTKQKKLVSYVLARLDSKDQKGIPVNYSQMTIEHIKPQRPMNAQNATETYAKIGNLLLVSEGLNGKLSNKSFLEKKKLLISAGIFLDAKLNTATSWDDVEIDDRTDYLAELAYNTVWPL